MDENTYFPSGEDIDEYGEWQSWSYQDLAWQYLRRNAEFQQKVLALNESDSDIKQQKSDIADEFFLKRYKDFREKELGRNEGISAKISASRTPNDINDFDWGHTLKHYQVAVVIDLRPSLYSQDALPRQIELITKHVENRIAKLRILHPNIEQLPSPTIGREDHLLRIRSFDLRKSGNRQWKDIGVLLRGINDKRDCETLGERARKHLYPEAVKFVEFGYIALVASTPTRSKIPKAED
ncbi:transcriptional regulator domain-containing protein [Burkholderia multivorans]|uniref:transcriptional regulator domain-containing protein n=1 Tax=Burkholderia multivorans TaxID=87883 RepID=UPI0021C09F2B|nr:hypothetical protein [Burkholderia multivorans]